MAKDDPLDGQVMDERYRIKHRIGSGGMSVVYLAERVEGEGPVAIKFLRSAFASLPDFVKRFELEAKACRRLDHDNCLRVVDFGVAFGSPYLAMEYLDGRNMSELIAQGPPPPKRAIAITRQILAGLRHAHARGVVHRDLKPGNIMLITPAAGGEETIKIMDFGTAQLLGSEGETARRGGTEVGTPWYMSPEQAAGQPTDTRADLYTAGVMLFELLTGSRPYTADEPMRVLEMHLNSPIPSARALRPEIGISPELEAAMVKALQKQPEERFGSAEAFDQALEQTPELKPRRPTNPISVVAISEPRLAALPSPPTSELLIGAPEPGDDEGPNWTLLAILGGVALLVVVVVVLFLTGLLSA
jgi:serine/threonine protein kinase